MREEKQLKVTSKPVAPGGPSVYSGPAGQVPEAQPAPNLSTAVSPGPCLYTPPEHHLSETERATVAAVVLGSVHLHPSRGESPP
jgi:hypothetical protein